MRKYIAGIEICLSYYERSKKVLGLVPSITIAFAILHAFIAYYTRNADSRMNKIAALLKLFTLILKKY